jgi:Mg2+-importing ATPase
MNIGAIAVAIASSVSPLGRRRLVRLRRASALFFVFLVIATMAYLALVEISKIIFYRFRCCAPPTTGSKSMASAR